MIKPKDPKELVGIILSRSPCSVQVGAVLADGWGIHSWGWNSPGPTGFGEHAEGACFRRASRKRMGGSTLYVAARRKKNGHLVTARPCEGCQNLIRKMKVGRVVYRDGDGEWREFNATNTI